MLEIHQVIKPKIFPVIISPALNRVDKTTIKRESYICILIKLKFKVVLYRQVSFCHT